MPELVEAIASLSLEARKIISRYIHVTPIEHSATFSRLTEAEVYLKYENLQKTGAFKTRGALFKVYRVKNRVRGVVTASAGNHAQGVAYAASVYGLHAVIVMPETASISKIEATKGYGAEVILHGRVYDDAEEKAREIARERNYEFIHAFNDIDVIAGQGTIGLELIEQLEDFDMVVVPIGGGGLISGIASVLKTRRSNIKVIGVEPENAPKMLMSLRAGHPVRIDPKPTIADGLVAKQPGDITYRVVSELVDDIVTVTEEEIAHAIYMLLERGKVLVEGAGATPVAALLSGKIEAKMKKVVAIVSGGNIDLTALYRVLLRGLSQGGRMARITGYVMDTPGELKRVIEVVARHRGNIVDIYHDRSDARAPAWHAKVTIVFEAPGRQAIERIMNDLRKQGYMFALEYPP